MSDIDLNLLRNWYKKYAVADTADLTYGDYKFPPIGSCGNDAAEQKTEIQQALSRTTVVRGFCEQCHHTLNNWPPESKRKRKWGAILRRFSTTGLEAAAQSGCKLCSFVFHLLIDKEFLEKFRRIEKALSLLGHSSTTSLTVQLYADKYGKVEQLRLNFPDKINTDNDPKVFPMADFFSKVVLGCAKIYENPTNTLHLANQWLRDCSENHKACVEEKAMKWPTRLLSIADNVKLSLTAAWTKLPKYATLSYCWGGQQPIVLTSNTFSSFLADIPHKVLPKTIQDAIYIARSLGLQYLWVDALCIIQGSASDWASESARMRSIYGGAHVNIAASSSTNVHEGCFTKPPGYVGGFFARTTTDNTVCNVRSFYRLGLYEESTTNAHLATRAWAFQERLLARRTIYFGDHGVFWECSTTTHSEFHPEDCPYSYWPFFVQHKQAYDWEKIVQTYSRGCLTNDHDKLPALSGIARHQQEMTGDEYLAGMWKKDFLNQLSWFIPIPDTQARPKWRAPSWSWSSVDGEVSYDDVSSPFDYRSSIQRSWTKNYVQILECNTKLAGLDPFGAVSGGELRLKCSAMLRGKYSESVSAFRVVLDALPDDKAMSGPEMCPFYIHTDYLNDGSFDDRIDVFLLPLYGGKVNYYDPSKPVEDEMDSTSDDEFNRLEIVGIVLKHTGSKKGCFCRIGSFGRLTSISSRDEHEYIKENGRHSTLIQYIEMVGASTAESECAEILLDAESSEIKYAITII